MLEVISFKRKKILKEQQTHTESYFIEQNQLVMRGQNVKRLCVN